MSVTKKNEALYWSDMEIVVAVFMSLSVLVFYCFLWIVHIHSHNESAWHFIAIKDVKNLP